MDDPGSLWGSLLFLIVLLLCLVFPASETSLTAIGRYKIRELIDNERTIRRRKNTKIYR